MPRCCIKCCSHNHKQNTCRYHRFPSDPETCAAWVRVVGVEDFLYLNSEILHERKRVCSCHFVDDDYSSSLKIHLKLSAIPSIIDERLIPISDEKMENFLSPPIIVPTIPVVAPIGSLKNLQNVASKPKVRKKKSTNLATTQKLPIKRMRQSGKNSMRKNKSVHTKKSNRSKQPLVLKVSLLLAILRRSLNEMDDSSAKKLMMNIELLLDDYRKQSNFDQTLKNDQSDQTFVKCMNIDTTIV